MSDAPESPCSGVCFLDPRFGWCAGCFRKPGEIAEWPQDDAARRQAILDELDEREAQAAEQAPWEPGRPLADQDE